MTPVPSPSGTSWTEQQARSGAQALLRTAGLAEHDLTLLRFGNNGVFRVGNRYVIRVARPETPPELVAREVEIATTLAEHDVPVVRLADLPMAQPLTVHGVSGTVWDYLSPTGTVTYGQFGALLQAFHAQTDTLALRVPSWQPLASARRRLDVLAYQYPAEDIAILEQVGIVEARSYPLSLDLEHLVRSRIPLGESLQGPRRPRRPMTQRTSITTTR